MMTVRMPDGTAVTFNAAFYIHRGDHWADPYTAEGGDLLAQVPLSALIELAAPCRVERPTDATERQRREIAESAVATERQRVRRLARRKGKR